MREVRGTRECIQGSSDTSRGCSDTTSTRVRLVCKKREATESRMLDGAALAGSGRGGGRQLWHSRTLDLL